MSKLTTGADASGKLTATIDLDATELKLLVASMTFAQAGYKVMNQAARNVITVRDAEMYSEISEFFVLAALENADAWERLHALIDEITEKGMEVEGK